VPSALPRFIICHPLAPILNYSALRAWIETSSFRPARLDGRPVAGLFKMRMEASVRRM